MELNECIDYVFNSVNNSLLFKNNSAKIESNMILDCATRIYISNNISKDKLINKALDNAKKSIESRYNSDQPKATDKQIAFLVKLGYDGDIDSLNITEAKHLIQDLKSKKKINPL